jgi:RNA polymerase sigma-70 factor (ECF subfamily)
LLGKYQNLIVNFIYKIVNNRAEAEELAQDVFFRIYRARESYEPIAPFAAWIYRIAVNASLKAVNKRRFRFSGRKLGDVGNEPPIRDVMPDRKPSAEGRLVCMETGEIVRHAIASLPKNEKLALILRRYEGSSYKEIAIAMNCTEGAEISAQDLKEPPGKWWKDGRIIEQIKLTPDQQDRIESIFRKNRRNLTDQKAELDRRRLDLDDLLSMPNVSKSAALTIFEELQSARQGIERSTFLMRIQIRNLLFQEQQKKLEDIAARLRRTAPARTTP